MSQKNKSDLKKMFVSQAIPTESNFSDLIDSVQATLVANGNIKLRNRSDGSVEINAEIPEPKPVIPKFINQFFIIKRVFIFINKSIVKNVFPFAVFFYSQCA